jgi:hypothetical protein
MSMFVQRTRTPKANPYQHAPGSPSDVNDGTRPHTAHYAKPPQLFSRREETAAVWGNAHSLSRTAGEDAHARAMMSMHREAYAASFACTSDPVTSDPVTSDPVTSDPVMYSFCTTSPEATDYGTKTGARRKSSADHTASAKDLMALQGDVIYMPVDHYLGPFPPIKLCI